MARFRCVPSLLGIILASSACLGEINAGPIVACYFSPFGILPASSLPFAKGLCTHLIYAFGSVDTSGSQPGIAPPTRIQEATWQIMGRMRKKNPSLRVTLSLQQGFPALIDSGAAQMATFAKNAVSYLRKYDLDGLDIDWEYPSSSQKDTFSKLLSLLREAIWRDSGKMQPGQRTLQLSVALPNNPTVAVRRYDINMIDSLVDFATAMTYDFHLYSAGDNTTGYNSALFPPNRGGKFTATAPMIEFYLARGMSAHKLLMGIPTFGRSWTLERAERHGLGAPAIGKGGPAPLTHLKGVYTYPDTCKSMDIPGAAGEYSADYGASYLYHGDQWVSYDDVSTVTQKAAWARMQKLGGAAVWALHLDDLGWFCGQGTLPLVTAIGNVLGMGRNATRN